MIVYGDDLKRLIVCFLSKYLDCVHTEVIDLSSLFFFGKERGQFVIGLERLNLSGEYVMTVCGLSADSIWPIFNQRICVNDINESLLFLIKYRCGINHEF